MATRWPSWRRVGRRFIGKIDYRNRNYSLDRSRRKPHFANCSQHKQQSNPPHLRIKSLMLTIGDQFPAFDLKAVVSLDPKTAFTQISSASDQGKWKVVFFWPKD